MWNNYYRSFRSTWARNIYAIINMMHFIGLRRIIFQVNAQTQPGISLKKKITRTDESSLPFTVALILPILRKNNTVIITTRCSGRATSTRTMLPLEVATHNFILVLILTSHHSSPVSFYITATITQ